MRGMDWIELVRNLDEWRDHVNAEMKFLFPYNAGNFLSSRETVSFSGRTMFYGDC
jgi:hypothetical protein